MGVQLNNKLDWPSHVNLKCKKANQRFHALKQIKPYVDKQDVHKIYNAYMYIRSVLEYCCPVFVKLNSCLSNKLEKVDRRAHRIIFKEDKDLKCTCNKDNIRKRREIMSLKLFLRAEKDVNHPLHSLIPERLKQSHHLNFPFCHTRKYQKSFIPCTTQLSNNLFHTSHHQSCSI